MSLVLIQDTQKYMDGQKEVKKALISQHNQAVSYSVIVALSSKRYSPWGICSGFSKRNMESNLKNEWRLIDFLLIV